MKENMALMIMVFNGLMLFGADFTWTEVSRVKENKYYKDGVVHQLGYAEINQNKQEVTVSNHYDCSCYYSPAYSKYVTEIRSCANNSKLRKITVKNDPPLTSGHFFRGDYNIENIVNEAFKNCTALQTVILPQEVKLMRSGLFENCSALVLCTASFTNVSDRAFKNCTKLTRDGLGFIQNVVTIGANAFENCESITEMSFGNKLTAIGNMAFQNCENISELTIPATVCKMGHNVFNGSGVITMNFLGSAPIVEADTFSGVSDDFVAYVMDGSTGWDTPIPGVWNGVKIKYFGMSEPTIYPQGGIIAELPMTVTVSCPTEDAIIYYTTDGSEPTRESQVYRKFRIYGKTTVKALAVRDGMQSEVVTAEYALGRCVDPVFSLADGSEFTHSNQVVSIRWNNDGVLRYTLDGTDPTPESPVYEGPLVFSDSAELRAKVFSDDFFDSAVVTSRLTRVWENVATPVIDAAESFTGSKTKVVISCATDGATVRYTLNGNEPNSHSAKYKGPIYVTDSCTVKAYATMLDYLDSAVATQSIEKVWGIGDSLGKPDHGFTTDGTGGVGWTRVTDATSPNGEAMKSGAITHNQTSALETTVMGPGTLTFSWMTSCEEDPDGRYEWDHVEFSVDGVVLLRRDGETQWKQESVRIEGDGAHAVAWTYKKDDIEGAGEDAAWVAGYGWVPDYIATQTTENPVPYAWLNQKCQDAVDEYDVYESLAKSKAANGRKVWECYVVGLDPEVATNDFKITSFPMKEDGTPDFDNLTFAPPKSEWNVQSAVPKLKGRAQLDAGEWQDVPAGGDPSMRFFKIEVELP